MRVFFSCSSCHQPLSVPDYEAGEQVRCPRCHATIYVPPPSQAELELPERRPMPRRRHSPLLDAVTGGGVVLAVTVAALALTFLAMFWH